MLTLIAKGATNGEIANELELTKRIITNAVSIILKKLHVDNRTVAAVRAITAGLIELSEEPDE